MKLGPEEEKELPVKAGGVRGPGGGNSRCTGSEAGTRARKQPSEAGGRGQQHQMLTFGWQTGPLTCQAL